MILYFELVVRVERFGLGPIGMMCAWGHTCLIRDGYSGCVLGSVFWWTGLDVPVRLEGSPSEFLIQRKKSFVCIAYSSAFFWFLSLLFCYSSCHCVLLCVFVCYYVYHVIRLAFLACICGLSPWCSSFDRVVWLFVPHVHNLCSCLCDFNVVYLSFSAVIILPGYLFFGFRLHAFMCEDRWQQCLWERAASTSIVWNMSHP